MKTMLYHLITSNVEMCRIPKSFAHFYFPFSIQYIKCNKQSNRCNYIFIENICLMDYFLHNSLSACCSWGNVLASRPKFRVFKPSSGWLIFKDVKVRSTSSSGGTFGRGSRVSDFSPFKKSQVWKDRTLINI